MMLRHAVLAACLVAAALAVDGGDVSQAVSSSAFSCAKKNGWQFVIVRSYRSFGSPDPNAGNTLAAAASAGIQYRDVYHFPCLGKDAAGQVRDDVNGVGANNFGMLWFDVETNPSPGCGWSSNKATNCNFLAAMINQGAAMGKKMGIYSSVYMWESIMGSCTVGADHGLALWYAHYDNKRTFSDFKPFGGWTKPAIKQYNDHVAFNCGFGADANWYA